MWDFREAFLEWVLRWPRPDSKNPPHDPAPSSPQRTDNHPKNDDGQPGKSNG